jgi:hypothetical protein
MKESPLFVKSFEMLEWLLDHTRKFPKHQRFVMAKRMEEAALAFHDNLIWATKTVRKASPRLERFKRHPYRLHLTRLMTPQPALAGVVT